MNGTIYKPGGVVVLSMEADPTFGLIEDIIVFSTDVFYLVCEELTTDCFNSHFHSYEVTCSISKSFIMCEPSDLYDHNVLELYKLSGHIFVTLKYYLVEQY